MLVASPILFEKESVLYVKKAETITTTTTKSVSTTSLDTSKVS